MISVDRARQLIDNNLSLIPIGDNKMPWIKWKEYQSKIADVNSKNVLAAQKLQIEREKNQIARENMQNDLEVAKLNAKNRNNKK